MRHFIASLLCFSLLTNCVVKKKTSYGKSRTVTVNSSGENTVKESSSSTTKTRSVNKRADDIVAAAMTFSGTRYKYGGTNKRGMDCSGLIYVALQENDIRFPRVSYQMAKEGKRIALKNVAKGDLLFFKTSKSGKRINHVGLVVDVDKGNVKFIHSTSSRGVIISSLREGYWNHAFIKATRIL